MMNTLKDLLVSGVGKVAAIPQKVASWSQKTQIIVAACTAGTLMIASVGGVAVYQHSNQTMTDTVADAEPETQTEEVVKEIETEMPEEVVSQSEIRQIPTFVSCTVSGDSVEKDLTLYIKGTDKKKISGEKFSVKLIDPDDKSKLSNAISAIEDIDEQIENLEEDDTEESSDSVSIESTTGDGVLTLESDEDDVEYISSVTGEAVTAKEELLCAKEEALDAYAQVLASLDGETYTDSDKDGMIYIDSIEDGDYLACLVPDSSYDPTNYAVKVTVKETIEYEVIESIEDKVVSEAAAGDANETHEDVVVEAVATDTVEWVDSSVVEGTPIFKAAKAAALQASASSELNPTTVSKKKTETPGASDTPSQNPETPDTTNKDDPSQTPTTDPTSSENSSQQTPPEGSNPTTPTDPPVTDPDSPTSLEDGEGSTASIVPVKLNLPKSKASLTDSSERSSLAITSSAVVYSDVAGANTVTITVQASGVSNVSTPVSSSSNLTVSGSGGSYTLTASGAAGDQSATVTVTGTDCNGDPIQAVCNVTIKGSANPLLDTEGHALYLDDKGQTAAVYQNYSGDADYYYQTEETNKIYYGWQNIDGIRYYFDKNGEKVTGTQIILGNTYNFGSDGALLTSGYGIDVSKWQGSIDWAQASSVVSFAIVRAGFRGSSGNISIDSYAATNIKNAKANGVKVGLYVYSRAMNEVQAVEEASLAISVANSNGGISLPIYIDMEADNQKSLSTAERDAIVLAFCKTVTNAGYQAGVYANKNWLTNYLTPSSYSGYSIWCAQYNTSCTYSGRYDIWQYSSKGSIPGISGNVDLDQSFF
jgi:GH25 family lysozyme M1 (1,4-beta-N-acetylmuramidase)